MAGEAPKCRPRDLGSTATSTDVGVGMDLWWLRALGFCPYVVVGPGGACRVGWVPAAWCAVLMVLVVALQVSKTLVEGDTHPVTGVYSTGIVVTVGNILMGMASPMAFSGARLLLLLFSPRLARLMREVAALQRLSVGLNPAGPKRLGVVSLAYKWTCVVLYLLITCKYLGSVVSEWGGASWRVWVLSLAVWLFIFPSFPVVVLLLSTELRRLQVATRAVLPPLWEQLVAEVRDEAIGGCCSTPWCVATASAPAAAAIPGLAPFMRRARLLLLQTEEVYYCVLPVDVEL